MCAQRPHRRSCVTADPALRGLRSSHVRQAHPPEKRRSDCLVCSTYNRYGKEHCSQHQIDESILDRLIIDELKNTKVLYQQNWDALEHLITQWTPKAELTGVQTAKLEKVFSGWRTKWRQF